MMIPALDFAHAYGAPQTPAVFRRSPEDFVVEECLDMPLTGEGEHFWLKIRKRGENTDWIATKLANYFSVRAMDVGYGGKKDRHAVTTQWFSVYLPKSSHAIDWSAFLEMSGVDAQLLASSSHKSKLRKGEHDANAFVIRLHEIPEPKALVTRLEKILIDGVPNYFGEQRFGREGANLSKAEHWVKDPRSIRNKGLRGIVMSAARAYLFNRVLSLRVANETWRLSLPGDVAEPTPSGPLWGRGRTKTSEDTKKLEDEALLGFENWCAALENVGLNQDRRALVLKPNDLNWTIDGSSIALSMTLGPGQYATSVLREIAVLVTEQEQQSNE